MSFLSKSVRLSRWLFLGLLAYMPLHILLSTWLGTSLDVLPAAKVAKDVVLVVGFLLALGASIGKPWFKQLLKDRLVWLMVAYAALTLLLAIVRPTDQDAELLGVVYNTRFLLFFLYGMLLVQLSPDYPWRKQAVRVVIGVGVVVALFGILQYTALSTDSMRGLGYSRENGVLPAFFIDDKPDLERVMSTVRDPNSLGSYLIIVITLAAVSFWRFRTSSRKYLPLGILFASGMCLLLTFSRSAWLGMALAVVVGGWLLMVGEKQGKRFIRKKYLLLFALFSLLVAGAVFPLRNSYFVQNVIFHADESTTLEDPNELRVRFIQESVADVAEEPLGSGPGTAGLASIRNDVQGVELNENYYLQIAREIGVAGLLLFLAILAVVAKRLWARRADPLALALLASFIGLAVTNLLVHIWSNEAVAYTWWGLAGIVLLTAKRQNRSKLS